MEITMKKYLWIPISLISILAACSAAVTPVLDTPTQTLPTQTPTSPTINYYPLDTVTGNAEFDGILAAVAKGNVEDLISLFSYTKTACKTVEGLGGPPSCREGEAEGTMVEVFPFLESEGHHMRKDEINNFPGLNVIGLYAVYRVPVTMFSDVNYPAGDRAIVYLGEANLPEVVVHVTSGKIVRIDYIFGYPEYNGLLPQDVTDFILEPLK
jgi:hypothetical protein